MMFEMQMDREEVTVSVLECGSGEDEPDTWKLFSRIQDIEDRSCLCSHEHAKIRLKICRTHRPATNQTIRAQTRQILTV